MFTPKFREDFPIWPIYFHVFFLQMGGSTPTTRTVLQSHMAGGSLSPRALVAIRWLVTWRFVGSCWRGKPWKNPWKSQGFAGKNPMKSPTFSTSFFDWPFWPLTVTHFVGLTVYPLEELKHMPPWFLLEHHYGLFCGYFLEEGTSCTFRRPIY